MGFIQDTSNLPRAEGLEKLLNEIPAQNLEPL